MEETSRVAADHNADDLDLNAAASAASDHSRPTSPSLLEDSMVVAASTNHSGPAPPSITGDDVNMANNNGNSRSKKAKRLCRFPGCDRVIKSQGHCQRHGAKPKRCRIAGCDKQAQGTHDGMCKRHWKSVHFPEEEEQEKVPPTPEGESVYDNVLPASIAYKPIPTMDAATATANGDPSTSFLSPLSPTEPPPGYVLMPLVAFLRENSVREFGWHRQAERRARGMFPLSSLKTQLEAWERQLALVETLLLSGGTPYACWRELAHAWGRDTGFHSALVSAVFDRHGNVERKKRKDAKMKRGKKRAMDASSSTITCVEITTNHQEDDGRVDNIAVGDHHRLHSLGHIADHPGHRTANLSNMGTPMHNEQTMMLETRKQQELPLLSEDAKPEAAVENAAASMHMMM